MERHAWAYLAENIKEYSVRKRLDLIFDSQPAVRRALDKDYSVRNDAAHNYKQLPSDARDIAAWLKKLEDLVDRFEH